MPFAWEIVKMPSGPDDPAVSPLAYRAEEPAKKDPDKFLAVIIPNTGTVSIDWFMHFRSLKWPKGSGVFVSKLPAVDVARDSSALLAVERGYEWLFFLDSDVMLPPDAIEKLLNANLPIVNGMYVSKKKPGEGFLWDLWIRVRDAVGEKGLTQVISWGNERYVRADVVGAGCMLVHRSVFEKIQEKYPKIPWFFFANGRKLVDFFDVKLLPDPFMVAVSEDFWFCLLAKAAGFDIIVDTSVKCGHIGTMELNEKLMENTVIEMLPDELERSP
jgi:hypothetical protein